MSTTFTSVGCYNTTIPANRTTTVSACADACATTLNRNFIGINPFGCQCYANITSLVSVNRSLCNDTCSDSRLCGFRRTRISMYALTAVPLPPNSTLNDPAPIASPNNPIISDDILRYGMLAFLIMAGLAFLCFLYRRIKHYIVASRNRALPRKISKLLAYNIVICRDGYIPNKRGQLLLSPDSVVGVLKIDDEWCTCINIQTGTIGLVPKACVAGLKD